MTNTSLKREYSLSISGFSLRRVVTTLTCLLSLFVTEAQLKAYGTTPVKLKGVPRGITLEEKGLDATLNQRSESNAIIFKDPAQFSMVQRKKELLGRFVEKVRNFTPR